jgi:hypothetical protein
MVSLTSLCAGTLFFGVHWASSQAADWKPIEEALGHEGVLSSDGSFKVTLLREDVEIRDRRGIPIPPGMGLNSYAAFAGTPEAATVVGDTCSLAHEVNPVIDALRAGGIEVVALHNHMLAEEPRLLFLHFQGRGRALDLARVVRRAWDRLGAPAPPAEPPVKLAEVADPDAEALSRILGVAASPAGKGIVKFTRPRSDLSVRLDGERLPPGVGLASWAAFYACPCGRTMVMGDTCVTRAELQPAIDALRSHDIGIGAIHNHLLGEEVEVMFVHFEEDGDADALAKGVRSAWDKTGSAR